MLDPIWRAEAADQLDAIADLISLQRPMAAERLLRPVDDQVERVRRFPESARPGRVTGTRELIVHPNYVVGYQATDATIEILRVFHVRQRYP